MNGQFRTNFLHSSLDCPVCGSPRTKPRFLLKGGGIVHGCSNCTIEFLAPQPDDTQLKALYSESYYAAWGLSGQQDNEGTRAMKMATFRLRLALIRRFLPPSPHKKILDVGCATGYFLQLAASEGFQPFGVEYSSYAAARARLTLGADAIFQGTLEESPFPKNSFAAIALSDLLEHVRAPVTTLQHAESLMAPDAVLLIMTPDTGSFSHRLMGRRWTHYKPEHLFYFNRRSLTVLARRANLRIVHFERAKKALNLAYLHTQFGVYHHWLLSPLVRFLHRLAPQHLRTRNFYLSIGEMVAILEKNA